MWTVTVKGLLAHKLRLTLTALAIVLGVTFVSGALVLTDTLHNVFTTLVGNAYQHIDFEVRAKAAFTGQGGSAVRKPIPQSIETTVSASETHSIVRVQRFSVTIRPWPTPR